MDGWMDVNAVWLFHAKVQKCVSQGVIPCPWRPVRSGAIHAATQGCLPLWLSWEHWRGCKLCLEVFDIWSNVMTRLYCDSWAVEQRNSSFMACDLNQVQHHLLQQQPNQTIVIMPARWWAWTDLLMQNNLSTADFFSTGLCGIDTEYMWCLFST